ncbi:MAG: transglutaminase domain-containing protein [Bacilli bacterium]
MKVIRFLIIPVIMIGILIYVLYNLNDISDSVSAYLKDKPELVILPSNEYTKDDKYLFLQPNNDYVPHSYQDIINIFYSAINNGWKNFTFYCPDEYIDCINDVKEISDDNSLLTHINNYTHPYNNFINFKTIFSESGEVTIKLEYLYNEDMIKEINKVVEDIINSKITPNMDDETKILTIHDYIINTTQYDVEKNETGKSNYHSNIAYGALIEHYAICGGYADAMAIFLTKMGYKNYKIASTSHVWNAVYLNGKWLHLDLTWDDPVSEKGVNYLYHKYFLVDNDGLIKADGTLNNHTFDKSIYLEFK